LHRKEKSIPQFEKPLAGVFFDVVAASTNVEMEAANSDEIFK
jgi:hypothetical protein